MTLKPDLLAEAPQNEIVTTERIELNGFEILLGRVFTNTKRYWYYPAIAITIPDEVFFVFYDTSVLESVLHAAEHLIIITMKDIISGYDPNADIDFGGGVWKYHPDTQRPTILIYAAEEHMPFLFAAIKQIIKAAYTRIKNCDCVDGCYNCIITDHCGIKNSDLNNDSKASATLLLAKMVEIDRAMRLHYEKEREQDQKQVNEHKKLSQVTLLDFIHSEARCNE